MKRTKDQLTDEISFLTKHLEAKFKHQLDLVQFAQQVSEIITERVEDYIYQRYRDWDALDLLELMAEWKSEIDAKSVAEEPYPSIEVQKLEAPKLEVKQKRSKVVKNSQVLS